MDTTPSPKLLVIDDELEICRILEAVARSRGWAVTTISEPGQAGEIARSLKPDAIILDVVMPDMDGFEVLRRLADDGCAAEILVLSGYNNLYVQLASAFGSAYGLNAVKTATKPLSLRAVTDFLAGVRTPAPEHQAF
jgi:CheY-like chemotaxis protein